MGEEEDKGVVKKDHVLQFDLGTFEGFNFRDQSAMWPNRTAQEVVDWDHDKDGEAEFWPSGDNEAVLVVFKGQSSVAASKLMALDGLLHELGGDTDENFLGSTMRRMFVAASSRSWTRQPLKPKPFTFFSVPASPTSERKPPTSSSNSFTQMPTRSGNSAHVMGSSLTWIDSSIRRDLARKRLNSASV
jgi:hypothetical protein